MCPHDGQAPPESESGAGSSPDGFSIICAFNDREKLDRFLLASLRGQCAPFELLTIDNCQGSFTSAARILNETAARAKFDQLLFVHQDIALRGSTWLADAQNTLQQLGSYGAAGVAGHGPDGLRACVRHGDPPRLAADELLERIESVQTLDGCLLIVPRSVFVEQGFDEETCRGWHLYVADYCLDLARRRLPVYALPHEVYHESMGPADPGVFAVTQGKILKKHRDHVSRVYTTIGCWDT